MNPIYKEYIQFLNDNNINLPIQEGYFWLDNQIIKAYDKSGTLHKIYRLKVDNDLNITCKPYKNNNIILESWQDTLQRNINTLAELEQQSIQLIQDKVKMYKDYIPVVLTSDGKDSTVTLYLVSSAGVGAMAIFNNTSLDCADTYKHVNKTII